MKIHLYQTNLKLLTIQSGSPSWFLCSCWKCFCSIRNKVVTISTINVNIYFLRAKTHELVYLHECIFHILYFGLQFQPDTQMSHTSWSWWELKSVFLVIEHLWFLSHSKSFPIYTPLYNIYAEVGELPQFFKKPSLTSCPFRVLWSQKGWESNEVGFFLMKNLFLTATTIKCKQLLLTEF